MKPDWDEAPPWARFLTMDKDGMWRWHQLPPNTYDDAWQSGGMMKFAGWQDIVDWETLMEKRP